MITPQDAEARTFPQARRGGYDMTDVDNFLDQLCTDYGTLYKENASMKRRIESLSKKVTQYQETEEAMRATLFNAQKMGEQIIEDAKAKRAKLLEETEAIARNQSERLARMMADEENRLKNARASVAAMTESIRDLLTREGEFLDSVYMQVTPGNEDETPVGDYVTLQVDKAIRQMRESEAATEASEAEAEEMMKAERKAVAERELPDQGESNSDKIEEDGTAAEQSADVAEQPVPAGKRMAPEGPVESDAEPQNKETGKLPSQRDLDDLLFGRNYRVR